ncbi:MAG: diacylglycerol kinase [Gammaproteobacteria bacterium]|nr:MAG: diacylglycerol kinase [Gammaproteobacteria bacterium]
MANGDITGVKRILMAFVYSWNGFKAAYKHEESIRIELLAIIVFCPLGIHLGDNGVERTLLVCSIIAVFLIELINSAIEAVVDRFGGEIHHLSGRAKDIGSAAVAVAITLAVITWTLIIFEW